MDFQKILTPAAHLSVDPNNLIAPNDPMRSPNQFFFGALAALLFAASTSHAASPTDFTMGDLAEIWTAQWQSNSNIREPKVKSFSEREVIQRMTGKWTVMFGVIPNPMTIVISTNRLVEVSGLLLDGTAWKRIGVWRVVSNKLVLFLEEDSLPCFIFKTGRHYYIFDPWAQTLRSALNREKLPGAPFAAIAQPAPTLSKALVLTTMKSIDAGFQDKNAAAVATYYATNAVITATIEEDGFTNYTKYDGVEYQGNLEVGLRDPGPYKLKRAHVSIDLSPDGKTAKTTCTLIEDYQSNGKMKHAVTKQSETFELIRGRVLITKRHSTVTIR